MKKIINKFLCFINSLIMISIIFSGFDTDAVDVSDNNSKNVVSIAMALDNNYVYPTIVSIVSALENANHSTQYDYYIMHPKNFNTVNKNKIKALESRYSNCKITFIDMGTKFIGAKQGHVTTPTYYRLLLSELLPDLDRIIWMDGDTLVFHDLLEMYNIDMTNLCYRGFLDYKGRVPSLKKFGVPYDLRVKYICAGVMVINLKELRKHDMANKFVDFIDKNNKNLTDHDQTVVNTVCSGKIEKLPAKFAIFNFWSENSAAKYPEEHLLSPNKYSKEEMRQAYRNPTIVHCVKQPKPWMSPRVHCGVEWWQYAYKTPYFREIATKYLFNNWSEIARLPEDIQKTIRSFGWTNNVSKKVNIKKIKVPLKDGTYMLESKLKGKKVLALREDKKNKKSSVVIWDKNKKDNQKFEFKRHKDGYYTIQSKSSDKMLETVKCNKKKNCNISLKDDSNTDGQKWLLKKAGKGYYQIFSKINNLALDVEKAHSKNGTKVRCYKSNKTDAQKFRFLKVG